LLNKALRKVLGNHIEQAGSEVSKDRLRFDFTHFAGLTDDEIRQIDRYVNNQILNALAVGVNEMPMEAARKAGAVMLMGEKGEKYGDFVRVVNIGGGESVELCGGTHLENTSRIGVFKLVSESGIAAGIRRIEAVTGFAALSHFNALEDSLNEAAALLKTPPKSLPNRITVLNNELKSLKQELNKEKSKKSVGQVDDIIKGIEEYKGLSWLSASVGDLDAAGLRNMGDNLKTKVDVLLISASSQGGPALFFASVSQKAVAMGVHAGDMVKEAAQICGGNGGGRADSAQAGGKDSSMVEKALEIGIGKAKEKNLTGG
jgi:alanyl-tRNA synthetase